MAIKNIIARGIGFSPGSVKFIITHGFAALIVIIPTKSFIAKDVSVSLTAKDAGESLTAKDVGISLRGETTEL